MQPIQIIRTIGWGVFCACSWTWCIGLYFPIILIDRYGWPGWMAFAVPNVVGAAAFGYVIRHHTRSEMVVNRHSRAMLWFSLITVAFHIFFLDFLFTEMNPGNYDVWAVSVPAIVIIWGIAMVLSFLPNRDWLMLTGFVYAFSIVAFAMIGVNDLPTIPQPNSDQLNKLAWLSPVLFFGFLLCPYLDLTFHRAIQHSPSRHSFAIFGLTFLVMIVLTCFIWLPVRNMLPMIALAHILTQCVFTIGAHLREIHLSPCITQTSQRLSALAIPLASVALLPAIRMFSQIDEPGEEIYLRFMGFYALVFPSYVAFFITRGKGSPGKFAYAGFLIVSLILFELAIAQDKNWLMVIPIGACLAWIAFRRIK